MSKGDVSNYKFDRLLTMVRNEVLCIMIQRNHMYGRKIV
jgi:hypothetical protein